MYKPLFIPTSFHNKDVMMGLCSLLYSPYLVGVFFFLMHAIFAPTWSGFITHFDVWHYVSAWVIWEDLLLFMNAYFDRITVFEVL